MIYEIVQLTVVDPDKREEFIEVFKKAWNDAAFVGSHNGKVMRAIENPSRVDVIIEWDSLDADRQHRGSPKQLAFREKFVAYRKDASIEHFEFEELVP